MKKIFTLGLLLLSSVGFSQIYDMIRASEYQNHKNISQQNKLYLCGGVRGTLEIRRDLATIQADAIKKDSSQTKIVIRCAVSQNSSEPPLYVVDGIPYPDSDKLSGIHPNDIASFDILKIKDSLWIGCRPARDVIVVTTKSSNQRKFIIKDFLDGERIAGATVSFISVDKKDTLMTQTNDSGIVITKKLKQSIGYSINVSSVGYKTLSQAYKVANLNKGQEILLERDSKPCDEVILTNGPSFGCGRNYSVTKITSGTMLSRSDSIATFSNKAEKIESISATVFPNPLQRGGNFYIEASTSSDQPIIIKITGLDGKILLSQPQKAIKGINRFSISTDSRWVSGIYLVHLYANGKLLASSKLILQ